MPPVFGRTTEDFRLPAEALARPAKAGFVSRQNERKKNYYRSLCGIVDKLITTVFNMEVILSILNDFQPSTYNQIPYFWSLEHPF